MVRATWNGEVIAESDDTVVVEGNHYFPLESVRVDLLRPSTKHTVCSWKGEASYYTIEAGGKQNLDAAWYYPSPKSAASAVKDRVAFWRGVTIEAGNTAPERRSFLDRFRKVDTPRPADDQHVHAGPAPVVALTDTTFAASVGGHVTIVDLWAPWCGPCKVLHPIFDHLAHHHADDQLRFARLNVDENPRVAAELGVMSIPTLVAIGPDGMELERLVGLADVRTLEQFVVRAGTATGRLGS